MQGENSLSEKLLGVINSSGQQFMVPANVKGKFVIRYAICSPNACDDDINYSWQVISHAAGKVYSICPLQYHHSVQIMGQESKRGNDISL